MTSADLGHSLRTPLNHILGYSEMLQEAACENGPALDALVKHAKDLTRFIQSSFAGHEGELSEAEVQSFQESLLPQANQLSLIADSVSLNAAPAGRPDALKIRLAADRLLSFARCEPGSIPRLSASLSATTDGAMEHGDGKILVIDDHSDNRDILRRLLEREGYGVVTAPDGSKGLELLARGTFELVLLDVVMPNMDGFEVLKLMKMDPRLRETPVLMISALDETGGVVRCLQMGAEDYLMKPFDPIFLSARIGASLERKRLRDGERRRTEELQNALDELRRTQDQLLIQEKLASLGSLTAGIAHEIKNPLNFVTNFASAAGEVIKEIRDHLPADGATGEVPDLLAQLEQYVAKIEEHGKRADRIVKGMLLHSRTKSGDPEWVDLNDMLKDSLNLAYHGLRAHDREFNVRLETSLDASAGKLRAVPQELSRVFLNIINNACYAAFERRRQEGDQFHPVVSITTMGSDSSAEIRIRDNGAGIPAAIREKIFDPFFTTKPSGAGTGLGLSLSHGIVAQRHHGTIKVESEMGEGSEFIVTLPRSPEES